MEKMQPPDLSCHFYLSPNAVAIAICYLKRSLLITQRMNRNILHLCLQEFQYSATNLQLGLEREEKCQTPHLR